MLQAFINEETICMSAEGTQQTLTAEVLLLIGSMYRKFNEEDNGRAKVFKEVLKRAISDEVPFKANNELSDIIIDKLRKALREADN